MEKYDLKSEKKRILELYKNVKKGLVSIDSLSGADLLLINRLSREELKVVRNSKKNQ